MKNYNILATALTATLCSISTLAVAQITLIGDDAPHGVVADGDFSEVWDGWRAGTTPPFWSMRRVGEKQDMSSTDSDMGLYYGRMYSSAPAAIAESRVLDQNMQYQIPAAGDRLTWELAADVEYESQGTLSLSLVFGETERELATRIKLIGSDAKCEHFSGVYTLKQEDAAQGLPYVRILFEAENSIKVWIDHLNIYVERYNLRGVELTGEATDENEITLRWQCESQANAEPYNIYKVHTEPYNQRTKEPYKLIATTTERSYTDTNIIAGKPYTYIVTRAATVKSAPESGRSNKLTISTKDSVAPAAPKGVIAKEYEAEVSLEWQRNTERDIAYYSIERRDAKSEREVIICKRTPQPKFTDITIPKSTDCEYRVYAHDFSGNRSAASQPIKARVKAVAGAAFSDLILPMPITSPLTSQTWGAKEVLPRDVNNGIESEEWSYWGGRPVLDRDGKYHMVVTRWSALSPKGHWEWPFSTLSQTVSDSPIGPYRVVKDLAYDYKGGLGHNPDIILMQDGTYALYSLIAWKPMILTSKSMSGDWELLGEIKIDMSEAKEQYESIARLNTTYQFERNLSGVQLEDGSILMVTKFGAMMKSEDGLLGTYKVLTPPIRENMTIPERHRNINYEDPVMWRDSVQFHLIINGFLDKRAIYLRSADGIDWHYETGLAYTTDVTHYEDGTANHWDKLERPHIIQDEQGRATHISLAAIDVDKDLDYGGDAHSSKNLIIPLRKHALLSLVTPSQVTAQSRKITIRFIAEEGFNPTEDLDLNSLRLGASRVVNIGGGYKVKSTKRRGRDLEVTFSGKDNGIEEGEFALKLIGRRADGELVVGYTKLIR